MWCLSAKCHFVNGLYIQTSLTVNCLPATSDRYNNTYTQKWWSGKKKIVFSHPGGSVSLPGVRESGCISRRLPDDPGGFTCMNVPGHQKIFLMSYANNKGADQPAHPCLCCSLLGQYNISRFFSRKQPVCVWPGWKLPKTRFVMSWLK